MTDTTLALLKSATATFVAGGIATAELRNNGLSRWHIKLINVTTASSTQTRCTVYRGEVNPRNQLDYTKTGNGDTSPTDITVQPGEYVTVQWTFGTVGAIAVVRIEGEEILRGRRAY